MLEQVVATETGILPKVVATVVAVQAVITVAAMMVRVRNFLRVHKMWTWVGVFSLFNAMVVGGIISYYLLR